jgi:hypothetical protein
MANSEKSKNYWKGVNDGQKGKSSPPSKGLNWKPAAVIGTLLGGPVGGVIGAFLGDSNKRTQQKKQNNNAYKAGNKNR